MKSLKKFFALCLTLALVLSLAACAQKPAETVDRRSVKQLVVRRARAASLTQMPGEISWNCRR